MTRRSVTTGFACRRLRRNRLFERPMFETVRARENLKLLAYVAGTLIVVNEIVRAPRRRQESQRVTHL